MNCAIADITGPADSAPRSPDNGSFREMDHRIKNHLQLLASYARLASKRRGLTAGELAEDLADKLSAIAWAHDALHRSPTGGSAPALPFLHTLVDAFPRLNRIHVECDPNLELPASELAPLGMIVSEAVSNSLKHAFPDGRSGDVWVRLTADGPSIHLQVRDDGVGFPQGAADRVSGRALITALARQLGGEALFGRTASGGALVSVDYEAR